MRCLAFPSLVVLLACSGSTTTSVSPPEPAAPVVPPSVTPPAPSTAPPAPAPTSRQPPPPLPHVLMRPSTTTGPLDSDAIHPVLLRDLVAFRHCYQLALVAQPRLTGAISLRFTIHAAGDTADATVRTDAGLEEVGACVRATLLRERYPVERADTLVELPITMALPFAR